MIEEFSSSNKKSLKKDFFHKIGKYFHVHDLSENESNINSTIALNKISINESKNFSNDIIKSQINLIFFKKGITSLFPKTYEQPLV